ncbi:pirin family protein [Halomonadaceae bacterium KBTZ08]
MTERIVERIIRGERASDGDGVRLRRSLGQGPHARQDPFLMLDELQADDSSGRIGGFPSHPHRGFETVTYMLEGSMHHRDSLGNSGTIGPGGVQWMTAAGGIVHSETPELGDGRIHGFQLWINLPASEKMKAPRYQDIQGDQVPEYPLDGGRVRVIAGEIEREGNMLVGPVSGVATGPTFLDLKLDPDGEVALPLEASRNAMLYVYEGEVSAGEDGFSPVTATHAGLLSTGDEVRLRGGQAGAGLLLLAATPVKEPVVQHGPFVMNTREEIEQAIRDFQEGRFEQQDVALA